MIYNAFTLRLLFLRLHSTTEDSDHLSILITRTKWGKIRRAGRRS